MCATIKALNSIFNGPDLEIGWVLFFEKQTLQHILGIISTMCSRLAGRAAAHYNFATRDLEPGVY